MTKLLLAVLVCTLPGGVVSGQSGVHIAPEQPAAHFSLVDRTTLLSGPVARRLASAHSSAHPYQASTGEWVTVVVSGSYPASEAIGQHWANFFAGLVHGDELQLLSAYIAPHDEVRALCGSRAIGCYGENELVMTGDAAEGFAPEEVARHEYGHHIAFNRANPPWKALEMGPKRWASYANVCARARAGTAYPGDQSLLYRLNPGEAFAESYRLLNDLRVGEADLSWPVVDASFYPDADALRAVEHDVAAPWTSEEAKIVRRRFIGSRIRTVRVATPLDGTLALRLAPADASYDVSVDAGDGDALRATGNSSRAPEKTLTYQVCGQRSLVVRVAPHRTGGHFTLEVSAP